MNLSIVLAVWIIVFSVILFVLMGTDKAKARGGRWRISEKSLFILALLGGACGGWLGMLVFRHKTRHWYFAVGFPVFAMLQVALLIFLRARGIGNIF